MAQSGKRDEFYDALETRDPQARERDLFAQLPGAIANAMQAAGWARQLNGIDPKSVTSRKALAALPVLRKADLKELQQKNPPFGGFAVTPPGKARRLLMSPGPIFELEGHGKDWWGVARALHAAGFRPGDIVHNAFAYHLTPGGFVLESGAHALGCAVIPGGVGQTEMQAQAIAQLAPSGYVGTPSFLKLILEKADELKLDAKSLARAQLSGEAFLPPVRAFLAGRGIAAFQAYGTADLGMVAYETEAREGMVVNEDVIVEIVRPGTGDPLAEGEVGEVVVTPFNADYPLLRFATGDLSAVLPGTSPCGRTNQRLRGWMGRADQTTKIKGMFVHPGQVAEIARRHPELARVRLAVTRAAEQDAMTLSAECATPAAGLADAVAATLQSVTKLRGEVKLVAPGTLPNDGKMIADERGA